MWIALLVTWGLGVAVVRLIFRGWRLSLTLWPLVAALGLGVGYVSLAAARYWGFLAGITSSAVWTWLELAALTGIGVFSFVARKPREVQTLEMRGQVSNGILVALFVMAVVAQSFALGFCFQRAFEATPHGMWDAWGFWNTRARMLFLASEHWQEAFNAAVPHPDYPPLLPLTVVRFWEWQQEASTSSPFFTSIAFTALNALLLLAILSLTRNVTQGLLAVIVLLSSEFVVRWGAAQYADLPLAFYYLAATSCALMAMKQPAATKPWFAMLGLMLGAAAFTKNEGVPLMVMGLSLASGALIWKRRWLDWGALSLGAVPLLATQVVFKLHVRENNDLFERPISNAWPQIFAADRHLLIGQAMYEMFITDWAPWLIVLAVLGGCRRPQIGRFGVLALVLPLVGILLVYYLIFLITPHDLSWHLGTSIDRLTLQVWPTALCLFFYVLRTPEEMLSVAKQNEI